MLSRIGFVGQEPVLFNTTVRANLMYGIDEGDSHVTDDYLRKCRAKSWWSQAMRVRSKVKDLKGAWMTYGKGMKRCPNSFIYHIYIYIYMYIYIHAYGVYLYMYYMSLDVCIYIYVYTYVYHEFYKTYNTICKYIYIYIKQYLHVISEVREDVQPWIPLQEALAGMKGVKLMGQWRFSCQNLGNISGNHP